MIIVQSTAAMALALTALGDDQVKELLALRRDQLLSNYAGDLGEIAHFIVVEPGDTLAAIEHAAAVPFATNLSDGTRLGDADFTDNFEHATDHGGWFEAVMVLNDDGFALVLFIPDLPTVDPALLAIIQ